MGLANKRLDCSAMNNSEARSVLLAELLKYRAKKYDELGKKKVSGTNSMN